MYEHHLMEANYAMLEQPLGLDINLQVGIVWTKAGVLEHPLGLTYGIVEIISRRIGINLQVQPEVCVLLVSVLGLEVSQSLTVHLLETLEAK